MIRKSLNVLMAATVTTMMVACSSQTENVKAAEVSQECVNLYVAYDEEVATAAPVAKKSVKKIASPRQ